MRKSKINKIQINSTEYINVLTALKKVNVSDLMAKGYIRPQDIIKVFGLYIKRSSLKRYARYKKT